MTVTPVAPVGSVDIAALTDDAIDAYAEKFGPMVYALLVGMGITRANVLDILLGREVDGDIDVEGATHTPVNPENWGDGPYDRLDANTTGKLLTVAATGLNSDIAKSYGFTPPPGGLDWPGGMIDMVAVTRRLADDGYNLRYESSSAAAASGDYGPIDRIPAMATAMLRNSLRAIRADLLAKAAAEAAKAEVVEVVDADAS